MTDQTWTTVNCLSWMDNISPIIVKSCLLNNLPIKSREYIHPGDFSNFQCVNEIYHKENKCLLPHRILRWISFPCWKICLYLTIERLNALSLHESWAAFLSQTFQMSNDKQKKQWAEIKILYFSPWKEKRETHILDIIHWRYRLFSEMDFSTQCMK